MKSVRFWGTRGSLPVALTAPQVRERVVTAIRASREHALRSDADIETFVDTLRFDVAGTFGGNTSCVQIDTGDPFHVLCDLGSGLRPFGQAAMAKHGTAPQTFHVFMSHVHWDHIMGLPFFVPAYVPGNRIVIYGGHPDIETALRRQMAPPSFPVPFDTFKAAFEFVHLAPGVRHDVAGLSVTTLLQRHTGDSYGYRFEKDGRAVVYTTDSEHTLDNAEEVRTFSAFFANADLVIFDAMYSLADAVSVKADWGHSSNIFGLELCQLANAARLCLFHHEPTSSDAVIAKVLDDTRRLEQITRTGRRVEISAAYDGLEIAF
jgi:phosphoribosyl 1,2-cyclic phosphodiesterase